MNIKRNKIVHIVRIKIMKELIELKEFISQREK